MMMPRRSSVGRPIAGGNEPISVRRIGQVGHERRRPGRGDGLETGRIPVYCHHRDAFAEQPSSYCLPDPAGRPGDDRCLPVTPIVDLLDADGFPTGR